MSEAGRKPEKIAELIREAQTIAVISHVNPDGDTLSCATAMRLGLMKMGKDVTLYCDGEIPDVYSYLPGAELFRKPAEDIRTEGPFDLMLSVDVSDEKRLGACAALRAVSKKTAQIDHHPTNPLFMEVNSVDGKAPAAALLIREQLKVLNIPLDKEIAACLYTGISTDTGNFAFSGTNAECFQVMSELMGCGLPLPELNRILFREKAREHILLLGRAIGSLQFRGNGRIAVMKLTLQDFEDCGARSQHADQIVDYGLYTIGTDMAVLVREDGNGQVKFSLRSKGIQVSDVAQAFGGGGHPLAAGITMTGGLEETAEKVIAELEKKIQ